MTYDEIINMWHVDSKIDESNMIGEIVRLKMLHPKYLSLWYKCKINLLKKESQLKQLYVKKWQFYHDGIIDKPLTEEERKNNPKGSLTKAESEMYIEGDVDYLKLKNHVEIYKIQKDGLEYILKEINNIYHYLNGIKYINGF